MCCFRSFFRKKDGNATKVEVVSSKKEGNTLKVEVVSTNKEKGLHISHKKINDVNNGKLVDIYTVKYNKEKISVPFTSFNDAQEMLKELKRFNMVSPYRGYNIFGIKDPNGKGFVYWGEDKSYRILKVRMPHNDGTTLPLGELLEAIDNEKVVVRNFSEDIDENGNPIK